MSQANVTVPSADPAAIAQSPAAPATQTQATPPPAPAPAPAAPVASPAAAPPAQEPAHAAPVAAPAAPEPSWLKGRLDQARNAERKSILAELGVKDPAEAKAAIERAKQLEDAKKTELQRAKEEADKLREKAQRAEQYESAIRVHADAQLAALTEEQRAIVADVIGDDPARILEKLPRLKAGWASSAPAPAPAQDQPRAPVPAPASTTAATPPPASGGPEPVNHLEEWNRLRRQSPLRATAYYEKNARVINAQIEARRRQK